MRQQSGNQESTAGGTNLGTGNKTKNNRKTHFKIKQETLRHTTQRNTTQHSTDPLLYFSGKCSHGGILDQSRSLEAKGGINKDSGSPLFSPHHYLHQEAARLAGEATLSLLLDLRDTVSHKTFLRSLKLLPSSSRRYRSINSIKYTLTCCHPICT